MAITFADDVEIKVSQERMVRRMMERPSGCSTIDFKNNSMLQGKYREVITNIRKELRKEGKGGKVVVTSITKKNNHYHIEYPKGQLELKA